MHCSLAPLDFLPEDVFVRVARGVSEAARSWPPHERDRVGSVVPGTGAEQKQHRVRGGLQPLRRSWLVVRDRRRYASRVMAESPVRVGLSTKSKQ